MIKSVLQRFEEKYLPEPNTGCWLWIAKLSGDGYGYFRADGKTVIAHRFAYEFFIGPIPPGHELDHRCQQTCCVNPWHAEAVTGSENNKRRWDKAGRSERQRGIRPRKTTHGNAKKTHCPQGHPYSKKNTKWWRGQRTCRVCHREYVRNYKQKRKAGDW